MVERLTIYEVARRSGVSTATVSRVMDNGTGFSAATRERVRAVARELGWVPSGSARGLARRRAGIVGLLFPDLSVEGEAGEESPLYVDHIIRGAERAAAAAGEAVLIAATRGTSGRDLAFAAAGKVDGLVVLPRSLSDADLEDIAAIVPVLLISNRSPSRMDHVGADNRGGMRRLVEHLIDVHAYRDIAFIGGPELSPDGMERFAGYRQALAAADLPLPASPDVRGHFTEAGGMRAVHDLMAKRARPPQAIVCANDEMAIGALTALRGLKVKVPADTAVTGFDGIAAARHVSPTLTTVKQPMREIGEHAVRAVLTRVADRYARRHQETLPTELVIRRSCGCRERRARAGP